MENIKHYILIACALISLVIILDFVLAEAPVLEKVTGVQSSLESHNNAGGNSHFSFKIRTENHHFSVSENFALNTKNGDLVKISVTPLFNEVNTVELVTTGESEIYSLRLISGLFLPLLIIIILALGYKFGSKWSNVVFVFEVLALADLIFLLK